MALGAVQLENGFGFAFEDAVLHAVLFVFAAAKRAFDLDVSAFLKS